MKIGFVLDDSLDRPDGAQQYITTLGEWMANKGHEVYYLVGQTERHDLDNVHSLAKNIQVRFNGNRLSVPMPASRKYIGNVLSRLQLDILHVQMPYSPLLAGRVLQKATNEGLVGTFHILPSTQMARLGTKALGLLQKSTLKKFDRVFTPSEPARKFAAAYYGLDCEVLHNPVEVARFFRSRKRGMRRGDNIRIVFLGRLVERKGCQYLLDAIKTLQNTDRLGNAEVVIGGKGPMAAQLKNFVNSNGLSDVVRFEGFVPEADKAGFLAGADLAVFPATGGESFGIILVEAMASGSGVVIGGDNDGYRSVLGDWAECLVDPKDIAGFADKLERFINDKALRQRTHKSQQSAVYQYDVGVIGQKLLNSYESIIAKRH
jgi:phosphatidyl-myo-inositol alpha-mannosyltransferase